MDTKWNKNRIEEGRKWGEPEKVYPVSTGIDSLVEVVQLIPICAFLTISYHFGNAIPLPIF